MILLLLRPLGRWGSADDQASRLREGVDSAVLFALRSMACGLQGDHGDEDSDEVRITNGKRQV